MTLSEMIAKLEALKLQHGDLEVYIDWEAEAAPLDAVNADAVNADVDASIDGIVLRFWDYA